MRTHIPTLVAAALGLGLTLSACGSTAPTGDAAAAPTDQATTDDGTEDTTPGGSMAMCAQDAPDCDDMVVLPDDGDDEPADRIMDAEVPIVTAFAQTVRAVEMAPGSVAEPFAVFLQEAVVEGRMVTVSFSGGETPCFVVDHVAFTETDTDVTVSVLVGQPDPEADCSDQQTSLQSVSFELAQDIGTRHVLDGSRTAPAADNV